MTKSLLSTLTPALLLPQGEDSVRAWVKWSVCAQRPGRSSVVFTRFCDERLSKGRRIPKRKVRPARGFSRSSSEKNTETPSETEDLDTLNGPVFNVMAVDTLAPSSLPLACVQELRPFVRLFVSRSCHIPLFPESLKDKKRSRRSRRIHHLIGVQLLRPSSLPFHSLRTRRSPSEVS